MAGSRTSNSHRKRRQRRRGGAVAEMVVCLPLMVMLVFASIEACGMIFLRQALSSAAYEGVRVGVRESATNQDVTDRCNEVLNGRQVNGGTVTIDVDDVADVDSGDPITITITAPCNTNSSIAGWFFGGRTITTSASMVKEKYMAKPSPTLGATGP